MGISFQRISIPSRETTRFSKGEMGIGGSRGRTRLLLLRQLVVRDFRMWCDWFTSGEEKNKPEDLSCAFQPVVKRVAALLHSIFCVIQAASVKPGREGEYHMSDGESS